MKLTGDERRALAFVAALLFLSAAVRLAGLPPEAEVPVAEGFDLGAHIEATEEAVAAAERAAEPLAKGETIDPNTASATELDRLPGIGPTVAARIVEERDRNGPFASAAELTRVRGIGERTVERLVEHLRIGGARSFGRASPVRRLRGGGEGARGGGGAGSGRSTVGARSGFTGTSASSAGMAASTPSTQRRDTRARAGVRVEARALVDINRADAAALAGLKGIGPVLAERIVAHRDSVGRFDKVEDLIAVRGIGPATLERLQDWLTVDGRR